MTAQQGQDQPRLSGEDQAPKLANRRPGWELPDIQLDLKLSSHDPLRQSQNIRVNCPRCNKRKSSYCYDCLEALTPAPTLRLPCKVSIITHHEEARSKNTGVQAAILAPQDVTLHSVEQCPDFDPCRAVVLFPSQDALPVSDLDFDQVDRVFIIDSRWKKAKTLVGEGPLAAVRHVVLKDTHTAFWRFHTNGVSDEGVCTVEALYYFFKQLVDAGKMKEEFAEPHYFDDLLWYFVYQHQLVREKALERYQQRLERAGKEGGNKAAGSNGGGQQLKQQKKQHEQQAGQQGGQQRIQSAEGKQEEGEAETLQQQEQEKLGDRIQSVPAQQEGQVHSKEVEQVQQHEQAPPSADQQQQEEKTGEEESRQTHTPPTKKPRLET